MNLRAWDTAVIGGGPAGCSAAISLAQRGLRVVLFEMGKYPHDKMCGEFLSPECASLIDSLGALDEVSARSPVPINNVLMTAPDQAVWETRLPGTALGLSRAILDTVLAERARQAGVEVREASSVTRVSGTLQEGFELEVRCGGRAAVARARTVVGAYGKRAALDRVLERRFLHRPQPFVALKAHFHGPRIPNRIELHGFPGGYCGMSEIENDKRVVCLLAREPVFQRMRGQGHNALDGFIRWMAAQNPFLESWFQGAERLHQHWIAISQVPFVPKQVVEKDVLMTGDAAGMIVPLAGNGISMALESGMLAAGYLAGYFSGILNPSALRSEYAAAWKRHFGSRIRLGRVLQPLMFHPSTASLALRLVSRSPGLGRYLVQNTRGKPVERPWLEEQQFIPADTPMNKVDLDEGERSE